MNRAKRAWSAGHPTDQTWSSGRSSWWLATHVGSWTCAVRAQQSQALVRTPSGSPCSRACHSNPPSSQCPGRHRASGLARCGAVTREREVALLPHQARRRPEYVPLGHAHPCSSSPNRAANFSRSLPGRAAATIRASRLGANRPQRRGGPPSGPTAVGAPSRPRMPAVADGANSTAAELHAEGSTALARPARRSV